MSVSSLSSAFVFACVACLLSRTSCAAFQIARVSVASPAATTHAAAMIARMLPMPFTATSLSSAG